MTLQGIPFVKANACGNDFLLIDAAHAPSDIHEFTRRICDRHLGVGADGVEWLEQAAGVDVVARLINADGSEAEISGNGTRCVASWFVAEHGGDQVLVRTGAGDKTCRLTRREGPSFAFDMQMGKAEVQPEAVVRALGREVRGVPVSTGNPHFVIFVEQFLDGWQALAADIQGQHEFPQGVNVEFVRVTAPGRVEALFFERGAGETQSSGTGSCASAAAALATGRVSGAVEVVAPGGAQTVRMEAGALRLEGPATLVCRGEFFR